MADLNDIAVFVRVAQFESFSRAAHALGMPVSTVSRKVTALEERLGATLLQRTTRKLSLTAQGRAYCNQCSEPLSLFDKLGLRERRSRRSWYKFGQTTSADIDRNGRPTSCGYARIPSEAQRIRTSGWRRS
jgi:DNA-binding transcriptional LysR family regulator